jgi:hypothetical protein
MHDQQTCAINKHARVLHHVALRGALAVVGPRCGQTLFDTLKRLARWHLLFATFVAHESGLRFGSLNHAPGDAINPLRPVEADSNTLILLPLSGGQPT